MTSEDARGVRTNGSAHHTVSSAELARRFGQLRLMDQGQVMHITHHGRITHTLTSHAHYVELERSFRNNETGNTVPPSMHALADCIGNGVLMLDNNLVVTLANRAAHALLDCTAPVLIGQPLFDMVPILQQSLVATYLRRAVACKEQCSIEIPSLIRKGNWVRVDIQPSADYITLVFNDITEEMKRLRLGDARQAIREAISVHDGVSYVCVNARGHIEHTEASFCNLVQLSEDRLRHVAFADLVPTANRVAFRETLDRVLTKGCTLRHDTLLLSNDGRTIPVRLSIAPLRGTYGHEGAVVLLTEQGAG